MTETSSTEHDILAEVPHLVVSEGVIEHVSPSVTDELEVDCRALTGRLADIGTRLDDVTLDELLTDGGVLRMRLTPELMDRPVRLRRIGRDGERVWLEVRSLVNEFRMESLLRRSGAGHMLLSPKVKLEWSMSANELSEALPGDDPMAWIELMDADDMQTLGKAIYDVGEDPNLRRTVSHRLHADQTYTVIDTVESAMHDPDLRAVLVRSRLEGSLVRELGSDAAPFAGITVSDHMPIGVIVASVFGVVLHRNAVASKLVGARVGQRVVSGGDSPGMMSRLSDEESSKFNAVFAAAAAGQPSHCTVASPFDPQRWLRISVSAAAASTMVLTIEDATELAEAEGAVRASNRLLEALDSHSEDMVIVFDALGRSRYVSSAVRRLLGETAAIRHADEVIEYVQPGDRSLVSDLIRRVQSQPMASGAVDVRMAEGSPGAGRWHHATMTNLLEDPDVQGMVLTVRDVHERYLADRELLFKATHDSLTMLPDRAAVRARLDAELSAAKNTGSRTALVFCDIDNFKTINDRAGHRVGDRVLSEVADRLRSALRAGDVVGRYGGDEFVLVAPAVTDESHALEVARRVFAAVNGAVQCDGIDVDVSVSMGVAVTDPTCETAEGLVHRADAAMYDAKERGRGRVALYSANAAANAGNVENLTGGLAEALRAGQITMHYQPIVPLTAELPRGYECLARWNHPIHGVIDAAQFLGLAESGGMGDLINAELLRLAISDERPWLGDDGGYVAINMSVAQLADPMAGQSMLDRLRLAELDPPRVAVEVGEEVLAHGTQTRENLEVLRSAGIRVVLDRFGSGNSALSQLHLFPLDGIKIDPSVINPVVDENLVRLIVAVAGSMNISTVAIGVEESAQLDTITRLGVDAAQGFLVGRPSRFPAGNTLQ